MLWVVSRITPSSFDSDRVSDSGHVLRAFIIQKASATESASILAEPSSNAVFFTRPATTTLPTKTSSAASWMAICAVTLS